MRRLRECLRHAIMTWQLQPFYSTKGAWYRAPYARRPAIMRVLSLALALASANVAFGHDYKLKERVNVPRGWSRVGPAPSEHNIELRIGLQQSDFETLEQHLLEVSDRE